MLLTITTTCAPATDLGFLLAKHPDRVQSFDVTGGTAHVWYPEAGEARCTAALLLDVDPVALARPARKQGSPEGFSLGRHVNDRPYAASSLLTTAIGKVFRTALKGSNRERADLAARQIPLELALPAVPCRGGPEAAEQLFAPLGWAVSAEAAPLDPEFPEWGASRHVSLRLTGELRLADALNHLYVLLPVLDDAKHYWISEDEVDKLLRAGAGWLAGHPAKELITRRYLNHRRRLTLTALERLQEANDEPTEDTGDTADTADTADAAETAQAEAETAVAEAAGGPAARKRPLVRQRKDAVLEALEASGAARVLDLGCGSGALLLELADRRRYTEIVGADVSSLSLRIAERRLKLDRPPARGRLTLLQSALTYCDDRLAGYDAAVLMEVIEHVDEARLPALEHAVFGHAAPRTVIVTTPNAEHNVRYEGLTGFRHDDHRFEWTRAQFDAWTAATASAHGYTVEIRPVGDDDPEVGAPTQLAVFRKEGT